MVVKNLYLLVTPSSGDCKKLLEAVPGISIVTEACYNVEVVTELNAEEQERLNWILTKPFGYIITEKSNLKATDQQLLLEFGPRLNFSTAFSTNAVSMCQAIGLMKVLRIELSRRYLLSPPCLGAPLTAEQEEQIVSVLHDKMTECRYLQPIESFWLDVKPQEVYIIDVLGQGKAALEKANKELGLAFDEWDLEYYTDMFTSKLKRNPTSVEAFDLAQSNSEHSRHWFFKGRMVVDGLEHPESLFSMIMATQNHSNKNNVIMFSDNSSAIQGHETKTLLPQNPVQPSSLSLSDVHRDIIFTAETHNFPTGVAPFPGATTGTGGRIRDVQAAGRGAHVVAGTAGYSFGNLHIPGYDLAWETKGQTFPGNFALPLEVAVEASNGASDYGNKFGEPVLAGFARSCGLTLAGAERREYIKPIMFSGGIGTIEHTHLKKEVPEKDMLVVKLGGPAYRIGVGGGAASSVQVQGDNKSDLDFGAVQRGDAEMEQKLNRVIRACVELGPSNPVCSIHDQGAGGNGNVLKEIVDPAGAVIRADEFQLGDPTLSVLEIWGAEYQESDACLVRPASRKTLTDIGLRERCPISFVGTVTGSGRIQLEDYSRNAAQDGKKPQLPVDLPLDCVLASMPRKIFQLQRVNQTLLKLTLPIDLSIREALEQVLRLPSVASKRWLTNKVDRSVSGLVAQQQCVGPLDTPLADVAVVATSHFDTIGAATAIGEQPVKGLVNAVCGARMSVAEAVTNLTFALITDLKDVKCSGNWMWPAKLPGEGAALFDACRAMCDVMHQLGIAVDGGKDSLSMAARVGNETVKSPGTLVVSTYAVCPDITATVTPDLKCLDGKGCLVWVPLTEKFRLGGSALAQCFGQIGDSAPDLDAPEVLVRAFNTIQTLLKERVLTAGHDISDGGLITCLLEMAFAGNVGINVNVALVNPAVTVYALDALFAEEVGFVLETREVDKYKVTKALLEASVPYYLIGHSSTSQQITVSVEGVQVLNAPMAELRDIWESTSFQLERLQANPRCVEQEEAGLKHRMTPPYSVPFTCPAPKLNEFLPETSPRVAVIREEGSNGDREMASAFRMAGFDVWDVNIEDLCSGKITLDSFRGVAFVGGFSYADVLGSAKGWAAAVLFNENVKAQFAKFRDRSDTFSLGVCNGCQLMALIGWVSPIHSGEGVSQGLLLDHNTSERYESRWVTVHVEESPAIMLKGMAGLTFGIWVSHGEGRFVFKTEELQQQTLTQKLAPVKFVDNYGMPTVVYPLNPNGSPDGIAAVCSQDGRHLAIMPHPERCFLDWQCPWVPYSYRRQQPTGTIWPSPWHQIFHNAFDWCSKV